MEIGPIKNVDLRYGLNAMGRSLDIVAGSNRSIDQNGAFKGISLFEIDGEKDHLNHLATFPLKNNKNESLGPYGLCMYHAKKN